METPSFRCFLVEKRENGALAGSLQTRSVADLPSGDVLIRVKHSSLNYKDALAATGHAGVTKIFPHIPGIDAAGTVVESQNSDFSSGQEVIATGYQIGTERWGGWSELLRVPADWVVPMPAGLTSQEAMTLGTAGFTAAQSVQALVRHGITPEKGKILVTGATGGVGSLAVMILAQLGYQVVAVTGKSDRHSWLQSIGASKVLGRGDFLKDSRPLLSAQYAGAVDTVGGNLLATILKMISHRGCVACCGLTAGADLALTVYPFILRGVTLAGIDSAMCPYPERLQIWNQLAGEWKPQQLSEVRRNVPVSQLNEEVARILQGENIGRVVVDLP